MSTHNLLLHETGAQYSVPSEKSETNYIRKEESLPEETPCDYHETELKYADLPQDRNRTSTPIPPIPVDRQAIEEIIHHPQAFQVPPIDIVI